jgi:hypothetical protein
MLGSHVSEHASAQRALRPPPGARGLDGGVFAWVTADRQQRFELWDFNANRVAKSFRLGQRDYDHAFVSADTTRVAFPLLSVVEIWDCRSSRSGTSLPRS